MKIGNIEGTNTLFYENLERSSSKDNATSTKAKRIVVVVIRAIQDMMGLSGDDLEEDVLTCHQTILRSYIKTKLGLVSRANGVADVEKISMIRDISKCLRHLGSDEAITTLRDAYVPFLSFNLSLM